VNTIFERLNDRDAQSLVWEFAAEGIIEDWPIIDLPAVSFGKSALSWRLMSDRYSIDEGKVVNQTTPLAVGDQR
jgi:hypothetical protein